MNMPNLACCCTVFLGGHWLVSSTSQSAVRAADDEPARPNVILILADDMTPGDLASRNGAISRTPNLDRMAANSIRFENAYSASCVCAPARAALLTGRYPHRTGVVTLNMNRYPKLTRLLLDETTLADVLHDNGYATGLIGKWHCGTGKAFHPLRRGFDEFEGFSGSQDLSYFRYTLDVNEKPVKVTADYLTDDLSRRAIEFVRRHRDKRFFLHLAHYAPHRPLEAPQSIVDRYQKQGLDINTSTIYAMVEVMDRGIGELLRELKKLKLANNTVVIFASDNGPDPITGTRFNGHLRGTKYEMYEGGIRVPLFVHCPGRFDAGSRDQLVHFVDMFPTILELSHVSFEPVLPLDGVSFADVLTAPTIRKSRPRFWQWNRGQPNYTHNAAVRDGSWKLVRPYINRKANPADSTARPVLYDLSSDPTETKDVSAEQPKRYQQLQQQLDAWCRRVERDRTRESAKP